MKGCRRATTLTLNVALSHVRFALDGREAGPPDNIPMRHTYTVAFISLLSMLMEVSGSGERACRFTGVFVGLGRKFALIGEWWLEGSRDRPHQGRHHRHEGSHGERNHGHEGSRGERNHFLPVELSAKPY
jgi:hypothetical protein